MLLYFIHCFFPILFFYLFNKIILFVREGKLNLIYLIKTVHALLKKYVFFVYD